MARLIYAHGDIDISHQHDISANIGGGSSTGFTSPMTTKLYFGQDVLNFYGLVLLTEVAVFQPQGPSDTAWLERWIERHCVRDVIAANLAKKADQFSPSQTPCTYLYFLDGWHRKEQFDQAILDSSRANQRPLAAKYQDRAVAREIVAWVELNLKTGHQIMTTMEEVCVFPVDDEDAVHFKLRWMDHQPT
jgi:hypothetical protein